MVNSFVEFENKYLCTFAIDKKNKISFEIQTQNRHINVFIDSFINCNFKIMIS